MRETTWNVVPLALCGLVLAGIAPAGTGAEEATPSGLDEASAARLKEIQRRIAEDPAQRPEYALLLHLDGDDGSEPVQDSSVYGFALAPEKLSYQPGRFGSAAAFDGAASRIQIDTPIIQRTARPQYLSFAYPTQTVQCWVRPEEREAAGTIVGAPRWSDPRTPDQKLDGWQLRREADGTIVLEWGEARIRGAGQAPAGQWTHLAAVIDDAAGQATLYVNGAAQGSAPVRVLQTDGRFTVGAGDAGHYKGLMDELAIHLRALTPEQVAQAATATAPLADPEIEQRMYALPANDHTFVLLSHGGLPGHWALHRVPEYVTRDLERRPSEGKSVKWVWEDHGWTYTWAVPDEKKKEHGVDFRGRIVPGVNRTLYLVTTTNPGDRPWPMAQMSHFCMRAVDMPQFHDFDAARSFGYQQGQFMKVKPTTADGQLPGADSQSRVARAPGKLFLRTSENGQWVLGIATNQAANVLGNFALSGYCMHSNPGWMPQFPAGASQTFFGCVYLLPGTLDDALKLAQEDMGEQIE